MEMVMLWRSFIEVKTIASKIIAIKCSTMTLMPSQTLPPSILQLIHYLPHKAWRCRETPKWWSSSLSITPKCDTTPNSRCFPLKPEELKSWSVKALIKPRHLHSQSSLLSDLWKLSFQVCLWYKLVAADEKHCHE